MELVLIGVGLSMDAFAVALCKGLSMRRINYAHAAVIALFFGVFQAVMPLIGWVLGTQFARYITSVDHWIAFALLAGVGTHMILQAQGADDHDAPSVTLWATVVTAIGTSLDAMAVRVSLAFLDVNIFLIALVIGLTTMMMSSAGILAGRLLGRRFGRIAETIGGVALFGLGLMILIEHLTA